MKLRYALAGLALIAASCTPRICVRAEREDGIYVERQFEFDGKWYDSTNDSLLEKYLERH